MSVVVGWQGSDRNAASTNTVSRFETETLAQEDNLQGLARMNPQWATSRQKQDPVTSGSSSRFGAIIFRERHR